MSKTYTWQELLSDFSDTKHDTVLKYFDKIGSEIGSDFSSSRFSITTFENDLSYDFEVDIKSLDGNSFEVSVLASQKLSESSFQIKSIRVIYNVFDNSTECIVEGTLLNVDYLLSVEINDGILYLCGKADVTGDFITGLYEGNNDKNLALPKNFNSTIEKVSIADNSIELYSFYSKGVFYSILRKDNFKFHLCLGATSEFTYVEYNYDDEDDENFFFNLIGLTDLNLLIQRDKGIQLDVDFKDFLTEKMKSLSKDTISFLDEDIFNSKVIQSSKIYNSKSGVTKVVIGSKFLNFEKSDSLIKDVVDFFGITNVNVYGLYSESNVAFILYVEEIGKSEDEVDPFYIKDLKLEFAKAKVPARGNRIPRSNVSISASLTLIFNLEVNNRNERMEVDLYGQLSKQSMSVGGLFTGEIALTDRLKLRQIGVDLAVNKTGFRGKSIGLNGMIECEALNKKVIMLRANVTLTIKGPVYYPSLIASAITSNSSEGVTLSDFIYAATTIDTSKLFIFDLVKIQDIILSDQKAAKSYIHDPDNKHLAKDFVNSVMPIKEFELAGNVDVIPFTDNNYIVTDKVNNIHYRLDGAGSLFLMTQFYVCTESVISGNQQYDPGIFVCGQIEFLKVKTRFFFKSVVGKNFVGAFTMDPVNLLNGLFKINYFERANGEKSPGEKLLNSGGISSLINGQDKTKEIKQRGPLVYYNLNQETGDFQFLMNGEISLFWGFLSLGADISINDIIDAEIRGKFAGIFDVSTHYKAHYKDLDAGKFFLRIDVQVTPFSQLLNDISNDLRKKTKSLNDKLESLKQTSVAQAKQKEDVERKLRDVNYRIDRARWWSLPGLYIEKAAIVVSYNFVKLLNTGFNLLIDGVKLFTNIASDVAQKALQALSWISGFIGNLLSLDSFCLTIDNGFSGPIQNGNKRIFNFNAEVDFTVLGTKNVIRENLILDFSKDVKTQLFDFVTKRGQNELASHHQITDLKDEKGESMVKKVEVTKDKSYTPSTSEIRHSIINSLDNIDNEKLNNDDISSIIHQTNERNIAMDKLSELLLENQYTYDLLYHTNNDVNDNVIDLMKATANSLEVFAKDNFFDQYESSLKTNQKAFTEKLNVLGKVSEFKEGSVESDKLTEIQDYFKAINNEVKQKTNFSAIELGFNENLTTVKDQFLIKHFFLFYYKIYIREN